ncbi:MAG: FliH/SctL family protein [Planctomycetota bacterium]
MPILKAQIHQRASKDAVVLDLGDIGRQAAKLRAIAEAKAEGILSEARDQAAKLTQGATEAGDQRGYAEGLERGHAEGIEQGKAEALQQHAEQLQQVQQQWAAAIADYETRFMASERDASNIALRIGIKLAEKVLHRAVQTQEDLALQQLHAALSHVLEPSRVKVHVNPADRDVLTQALPGIVESLDQVTHAHLVADTDVSPGGCVVEAGAGTIDAQVETQLDRLASLLLGETEPAESTPEPTPEPPHAEAPDQIDQPEDV